MKNFFPAAALFLALLAAAPASAQERHAQIRLIPETTHPQPGGPIYIAIEQTLDPGWHSYWVNPGDSGEPLRVKWTMPGGFDAGPVEWPTPVKVMTGPLASYGYTGKTILLQEIGVPQSVPDGPLTLAADIDILVCNDICIPESGHYEVTLNGPGEAQDNAALIDEAYNRMPVTYDTFVKYEEGEGNIFLSFDPPIRGILQKSMKADTALTFIPYDWGVVDNTAQTVSDIDNANEPVLTVTQKRGDRPLEALKEIRGLLAYTDDFGNAQSLSFEAIPAAAAKAEPTPPPVKTSPAPRENKTSFSAAILFALMGGLILNLMPCVFPVLSLKALKLVRMGGEERAHARLHGLLYTAGILAAFAAFALTLMGLQAAGAGVGWGFQLQNPGFVAFLSYLFFIIAINLAGCFEITVSIGGRNLAREHGYAATFLSGVLAAAVATPCTAPFMGAAMGYALAQPASVALAVFMALGLGLALPYLALSFVPALQKILPKPGPWMEGFRKAMALPMMAAAAWLAWVFLQQTGRTGLLLLLAGMAFLALGIALLKTGRRFLRIPAGVLLLAALYPMVAAPPLAPRSATGGDGWVAYTAAEFARLESGDDPLFVNMTAAWCITCKLNERAALHAENVQRLFRENGVVAVKGDWTNYNAEITAYLQSFGRDGVPLYVYYGPRKDGRRPDPVVLPQILTPSLVEKTIRQ